ncbi:hypothetical protein yc1106_03234 [Curvularia clavata]|uniref:Mid2 domain-containing protein n=1 Tax=Curvularia clavata TaxID=95742 RepID=A0A9Q8Z5C8_CURCL|nr:hypothetical protein yc1106_03234 [Curvularia clavata]
MLPNVQRTLTVIFLLIVRIRCQITSADSKFIGYYIAPNSVEPLYAGNAWVTSGSYAGDCNSSGRCPIATKCAKNLLHYDDDTVWTCGAGASCVEATIYATSPAGLPSAVNYACRMYWKAYTIYRELPATAEPMTTSFDTVTTALPDPTSTDPTSTDPTSTEAGVKTIFISVPAVTATSNTTATSSTNVATASTAASPQAPSLGQDKSWIAGVVIGPVFVIALVAAAVWVWRRRRAGQKGTAVELDGQSNNHWKAYPDYQQYHEKDSDGQVVELPSSRPPAELDTNGYR